MESKLSPVRISSAYAAFAVVWILFANLIATLASWTTTPFWGQALKGLLYVTATAGVVYLLVLRASRQIERKRVWYRHLFENSPQPMWIYDPKTLRFLEVNQAALAQYGYSRNEFLSMTLADIHLDEDSKELNKTVRESRGESIHRPGIRRHRIKNGSIIQSEVSANMIRFLEGEAVMVLAENVTARLEAEEAVRRSQALLKMAMRISRMGAWMLDLRTSSLTWSEELSALHEVPADFKPSRENSLSFYVPEHRPIIQAAFEACATDGIPFNEELEIITAKGRRVWMRAIGEPIWEGNAIIRVEGAFQDISEYKESQEAVNRLAKRLTTTLESIKDAFFTVDSDWRFTYINGETEKLLERKRDDLLGKNMWEEYPDIQGTLIEQIFRRALKSGTSIAFENFYQPMNKWFAVRTFPSEAGLAVYFRDVTKRHQEKETLRENEERLQMINAVTNDAIWEYTPASDTIHWSPGFETLFGYTVEEGNTGSFWETHVHHDDRERVVLGIEEALSGDGLEWADEYRFLCHDGHYAYVSDKGRIQRDSAGTAVRMIGGISDFTKRAHAEKALRESERQMATLLDNFPGMAYRCLLDQHYTMRFTSEGVIALTGYTPEELLNNHAIAYADLILPRDLERVFAEVNRAVTSGLPFELEYGIRTKDGLERHVWERGRYFSPSGEEGGHLEGFIMDVTDRSRAEAERERLKAAIDQLAEIVLITDPAGTIQYVNPAFERVTGFTREEAIGKNPRFLNSGEHSEAFFKSMFTTLNSGRTWRGRIVNLRKDKIRFTEDSIISPVLDAQGKLAHFVCVKNDVTDQLTMEEQYRQAQKMEAVGRLAGGVAHDFNNMLTVILVRSEIALHRLNPEDPVMGKLVRPLKDIHQAATRSADLTRQLLTYARRQAVEPRLLSINDNMEGTLKMLRRLIGENLELLWIPGQNLWHVQIDPAQIDQMVTNLTLNARDAIENIGRITIETHNTTLDADYCKGKPGCVPGEYVILAVSDNGHGMDKSTLSHIFEPFFTTKEVGKGTGLGLATVYGIVKQNNGFVNVYSEPSEGTTFRIYLPRHIHTAIDVPAPAEELLVPSARGETILLVEDEPMIRESTAEILRGLDYRVLEAESPSAALDIAVRHPGKIDLILTDVIMPEMNGQELSKKLLIARPESRCLFMSGYTANVIKQRDIADDGAAFIQKPFSIKALATKVREVLDTEFILGKT